MDKFEYKVRADEIKELIAKGEYTQAAEIADTIDWRRVKSVMMLCTISDLYKINRRYEDARDMLLLAYERRPGGRTICYSLCELSIKTEEFVQAVEYYKEFVQVAPKDPGRYILQYKLYEAQDVSLEERIAVLEELKKRDYREKWAYELAYLYHRVGLATRCVEECDELILWFGEGKYVVKAMELKMLHQPLSASQQEMYDHRFDPAPEREVQESVQPEAEEVPEESWESAEEEDAQEYYSELQMDVPGYPVETEEILPDIEAGDTKVYEPVLPQKAKEEFDIHVKTMDMGQYNTLNLQAELAAGLKEVLDEEPKTDQSNVITKAIVAPMLEMDTESLDYPQIEEVDEEDLIPEDEPEEMEGSEVFFGETGEINVIANQMLEKEREDRSEVFIDIDSDEEDGAEETLEESEEPVGDTTAEIVMRELQQENLRRQTSPMEQTMQEDSRRTAMEEAIRLAMNAEPPKELAGVLSQESDGQISLVVPEDTNVEKQITGQMNIQDILAEWENMKRESEERRKEEVRKRVMEQTGDMFTEFEASVRDGLLEQLESDVTSEEQEEPEGNDEITDTDEVEELEEIDEPAEENLSELEKALLVEAFGEAAIAGEANIVRETEDSIEEELFEELEEEPADIEPEEITEEDTAEEFEEESPPEDEIVEEFEEESPPEEDTAEEPEEESPPEAEALEETEEPEAEEEPVSEEAAEEAVDIEPEPEKGKSAVRALTREEKELFAPFVQSRSAREQLVGVIDNVSMAAYTGNVIITGEEGMDTLTLAKNLVREVKMMDSNFSGKVAKVSGSSLNNKNVAETVEQLANGALIIQYASQMTDETAEELNKSLQQDHQGIIIILEDTKKAMDRFLSQAKELAGCFNARMDVEALSNDTLVSFGRKYAKEMEYSIDELGILALHTRIEERQTIDHVVTVVEVKKIVDDAIRHANRKSFKHFLDVLMAKRYDEEDMIILSEKDFA
ncbi:MAG: hypothetical protein J1E64_10385 [Acetatifactor sp.]|nr:hypothetical protein [Acetatifactor sp.]